MTTEKKKTGVSVDQLSYESAVTELEEIITDLDEGIIDIDSLSDRFQRSIDIIEELDRRITRTRQKVEQLTPRLQGIGSDSRTRSEPGRPEGPEGSP